VSLLSVDISLSVFRCIIEGNSDTAILVNSYVSLTVISSHISAGRYAVRCYYGSCHVTNSRLHAISCRARSCTVQHSTVISTHSHLHAIDAVSVPTLIIDNNYIIANKRSAKAINAFSVHILIIDNNYIIANKTSVPAVRASGCYSIQASFLFLSI